MGKICLVIVLWVLITVLATSAGLASGVEDEVANQSLIKIEKIDGEIWIQNGYQFSVMLLVLSLETAGNCSCLQGPPLFLKPNKKQKLDFPINDNHLLAFYRFGYSQEICILNQEHLRKTKD